MGTNYCKNMTYDGCLLSRLDAHAGVYNVTIKDTTILNIKLIGGGTALIENTKVYDKENGNFIVLRADYGSTWRGDIIIKDCSYYNSSKDAYIISATWNDFPFFKNNQTSLPNVTIDNLTIANSSGSQYIFKFTSSTDGVDQEYINGQKNQNQMNVSVNVTIKNNVKGYKYIGANHAYVNEKIEISEE